MKLVITFEYEVENEQQAREIRDVVSPALHNPDTIDVMPDTWYYEFKENRS